MSRGRKIAVTAVLLVMLVAGALLLLRFQLEAIVAGIIEEHGSQATRTDVRVRGVAIELGEARASLSGLTVANPEGFGGGPAIELGRFSVQIEPASVRTDTIVLNDVTVNGARLNLLQIGGNSNLQTLLDNLRDESAATGEQESTDGGKIVIERFTLADTRVSVSLPELDQVREVTVPTITLNDIGRASDGVTATAAARQILEPILRRTMQSAASRAIKDRAAEELDEARDKALDSVLEKLGGGDEQ